MNWITILRRSFRALIRNILKNYIYFTNAPFSGTEQYSEYAWRGFLFWKRVKNVKTIFQSKTWNLLKNPSLRLESTKNDLLMVFWLLLAKSLILGIPWAFENFSMWTSDILCVKRHQLSKNNWTHNPRFVTPPRLVEQGLTGQTGRLINKCISGNEQY